MKIILETNASHLPIRYLRFYYYRLIELLVTESIIVPVVIVSAPTRFIRYILLWNLQFLDYVIMSQTMILFPKP